MTTDPQFVLALGLIFLVSGTIKGAVGMGLPTMAMGLMTFMIGPRSAIALVLVPMLVSNAWQVYRSGQVLAAARRYWCLGVTLMLGVGLTVTLTGDAPDNVLLVCLGAVMLIFVAVSATRWSPLISDRAVAPAQIAAGAVAGLMGGLTSVWAPPLAVYLAARNVAKDEFVRASGLLIFLGSLPLALGLIRQGVLTGQVTVLSTALLLPTIAGFTIGEYIRGRLSDKGFRRFLWVFFGLMGLNLIRRGML